MDHDEAQSTQPCGTACHGCSQIQKNPPADAMAGSTLVLASMGALLFPILGAIVGALLGRTHSFKQICFALIGALLGMVPALFWQRWKRKLELQSLK